MRDEKKTTERKTRNKDKNNPSTGFSCEVSLVGPLDVLHVLWNIHLVSL